MDKKNSLRAIRLIKSAYLDKVIMHDQVYQHLCYAENLIQITSLPLDNISSAAFIEYKVKYIIQAFQEGLILHEPQDFNHEDFILCYNFVLPLIKASHLQPGIN